MGRHQKTVTTVHGLDRRETGYYSTPAFVADFIASTLLRLNAHGCQVFDPCVGKGELVAPFLRRDGFSVAGIDVLDLAPPSEIDFKLSDFLKFYEEQRRHSILGMSIDLPYDYYVANPPYNCHEVEYVRANKATLGALFGKIGVLNMYSMFLTAMIDCAKDGALLGVITLDSFLTAHGHAALRAHILQNCAVHHVILSPTDLFRDQGADVRTCILILQKGRQYQGEIQVLNRPLSTDDFITALAEEKFVKSSLNQLLLDGAKDNSEFLIGVPAEIREMFEWPRLGELFPCVTGISTGNDSAYLSKKATVDFSVPFYKNPATRRFYSPPDAFLRNDFMELDKRIPNFMVRNKHLLFKPGITCSSMGVAFGAAYLPEGSTYGVNANIITSEEDTWWLLGYLNSHLVTYFVRAILNRSNMITAGYVSRIPVAPLVARAKERLAAVAREAFERQVRPDESQQYVNVINSVIDEEVGLSDAVRSTILSFSENLVKAT